MGGQGFRVQPEALGRYASVVGEQNGQLGQARSAVAGIALSGSAFGHLPNAAHLHQMYNQHAEANGQNLADLIEALGMTAEGLNATVDSYAQHDQELAAGLGGGQ
ncbi:hypothetical protein CFP65_3176 [Kitasatospora sp. MMS16-BH015]|nr:hypothetical protein CFP65_3176 [Kitasatospora sp. MMS16-BH015]